MYGRNAGVTHRMKSFGGKALRSSSKAWRHRSTNRMPSAKGSWPGVVVGSQNGGDGNVFASDATINQNDWALVAVGPADIYAFRRNAAGTGVDAAVYAPATNAWSAFPAPPNVAPGEGFPSGAGLFGATDGASIWLFAVGSDAAGTILSTRHDASGWTPWTAVPGTDSVLGAYVAPGGWGLKVSYPRLIMDTFAPKWWSSARRRGRLIVTQSGFWCDGVM